MDFLPLIGVAIGILYLPYSLYQNTKKNYETLPQVSCEKKFVFTENDFEVSSPFVNATVKWEAFSKILELKDFLLIYDTSLTAHIIPRRSFDSEIDLENVINLLKSKPIKEKKFLKK